jgi:hypothetical protein
LEELGCLPSMLWKNTKNSGLRRFRRNRLHSAARTKISISEYLLLCNNYGIEVTDEDHAHFESVGDSGLVAKSDFILYMKSDHLFSQFENVDTGNDVHWNMKVEKAWNLFDKSGDGKLTQMEFRWMTDRKVLTDHHLNMMFSKCDSDGDGVLDCQEFRRMILRNK